ncbi:sigma-70 family RNA polymerase sigma factor [Flavobacterium zepuense]|uniref:Sigma-70 family RNA polymerase sigma factor n=1 Tax=Flavobacterium zepuense TaxID=2593302 RepID=A0A552V9U5_9FLAO|nr:sigma-70 family RNA polymerase sigma factor [Flavobacterium zepuense]TRW27242.1 sigma-70 family RNA polymerase sigma factor [Flavobacterium zepuense]
MKTNLIKGLREGDHSSFKEIYNQYHFKVYLFTNRFTQQEADTEDIVQNVFIHLWNYRNNISPDAVLDAVLFKSSKQEVSRWYKKQETFPALAGDGLREDEDEEYESDEEIALQLEQISLLLDQIPEKRKKIFTLNKFEQRSYKEIADEMSMTPTAVAKQISKTISYLKQHGSHEKALIWFSITMFFDN